jgi:T4 RnlA family RNA ligase
MNQFQTELYSDLMRLCETTEAFYFVDQEALGHSFRIFLYRLASYTDFMFPNAMECRGHTFLMNGGVPIDLVSLPPHKFFNNGENPYVMDLDFTTVAEIQHKLDGSLISTVKVSGGEIFCLKTKGSFHSEQAKFAEVLMHTEEYEDLMFTTAGLVEEGCTVNFEICGPNNRIVIGYEKPMLKVLNIRDNLTGEYRSLEYSGIPQRYWVDSLPIPADVSEFVNSIYSSQEIIEGFIVKFKDGKWVKVKTDKYCALHKTKDSITTPRRLFEVCVNEGADDLRGMFHDDMLAINMINDMEAKVSKIYNHIHKSIYEFYNENKGLDRKSYAILAQEVFSKEGTFGLVMNLYVGKEVDVKAFMIKHYKSYDIKDEPVVESE